MADQVLISFSSWRINLYCTTISLNISYLKWESLFHPWCSLFSSTSMQFWSEDFSLMILVSSLLISVRQLCRGCLSLEWSFSFWSKERTKSWICLPKFLKDLAWVSKNASTFWSFWAENFGDWTLVSKLHNYRSRVSLTLSRQGIKYSNPWEIRDSKICLSVCAKTLS